jgi:alkylation response protein AidB-like acyl-CoA dehydrogenase
MDFTLTPEQEDLRTRVRAFAEAELAPTIKERDERQVCERAVWDAEARAGLAGLAVPPEYGGGGHSFFDYILALEEIGKVESAQVLVRLLQPDRAGRGQRSGEHEDGGRARRR